MSKFATINDKKTDTKRNNLVPAAQKSNFSPSVNSPTHRIMFFQRTIGNQAVLGLFRSGIIQAKLTTGQPGDIYEQTADMVPKQVMRTLMSDIQPKPA